MRRIDRRLPAKEVAADAAPTTKKSGEARARPSEKLPPPPPEDGFKRHAGRSSGSQPESLRAPAPLNTPSPQPGRRPVPNSAVTADEASLLSHLSDLKPPVEGVRGDSVQAGAGLGSQVVEGALRLKGKLDWTLPAYNLEGRGNDFLEFVENSEPLGQDSRMNCWEAVLYSAVKGQVFNEDKLAGLFDDIAGDSDYNETVRSLLNVAERQPVANDTPQPGDVLLFFGMAHVALSLGGDRVLSLWNGPNGCNNFQETTIEALQKKVQSSGPMFRTCMKTALDKTNSASIKEEEREEFYRTLDAYQQEYDTWEEEWVEPARSIEEEKPELGAGLPAREAGANLQRNDLEKAVFWERAIEELAWGEEEDKSNTPSRLLLKAMELENPSRFSRLENLRADYEGKFARFQDRMAVVEVIPQSKVWGDMQKRAASAEPSSAWKSKQQVKKFQKQAIEEGAAVQKSRSAEKDRQLGSLQDKLKARKEAAKAKKEAAAAKSEEGGADIGSVEK